jgi:hypothetical protein
MAGRRGHRKLTASQAAKYVFSLAEDFTATTSMAGMTGCLTADAKKSTDTKDATDYRADRYAE